MRAQRRMLGREATGTTTAGIAASALQPAYGARVCEVGSPVRSVSRESASRRAWPSRHRDVSHQSRRECVHTESGPRGDLVFLSCGVGQAGGLDQCRRAAAAPAADAVCPDACRGCLRRCTCVSRMWILSVTRSWCAEGRARRTASRSSRTLNGSHWHDIWMRYATGFDELPRRWSFLMRSRRSVPMPIVNGVGSGYFRAVAAAITCILQRSSVRSVRLSEQVGLQSQRRATVCATRLRPICSKGDMTSARSRSCSGIAMCERRCCTRMSSIEAAWPSAALGMLCELPIGFRSLTRGVGCYLERSQRNTRCGSRTDELSRQSLR